MALRLAAVAALAALIVLAFRQSSAGTILQLQPTPRFSSQEQPAPLSSVETHVALALEAAPPVPIVIERGQTVGGLLADLGVPTREHAAAVTALAEHLDLRRLMPGVAGLAYLDAGGTLERLRMRLGSGWVELLRDPTEWRCAFRDFQRRIEVTRATGVVDGPLERAVRQAGSPPAVAYAMAEVLRWDLDFNRDLRTGDRFDVLYEEIFLDDSSAGPGNILALSYENRGVRYEAYRFEDAYYDGAGRPLQKMFLRSPLPFTRVTSRFSKSRFHPVLKVRRPHWGVDYGAPTGTPVRVTAAGEVTLAGRNGGAGNMVEVRHVAGYRTAYLHLSRFAKGIRRGRRVAQGDVVGYVGATGLATAPHLDYRVKKDGRWIDPLSIHKTPSEPIPQSRMAAFSTQRDLLRSRLFAMESVAGEATTRTARLEPAAGAARALPTAR